MKIILSVIHRDEIEDILFCTIPDAIYKEFDAIFHLEPLDINAFFAVWSKEDFMTNIAMDRLSHITQLKKMILAKYKREYPELYTFEEQGLMFDTDFWLKLWIARHMKLEVMAHERLDE